jgi:hypothetical protein
MFEQGCDECAPDVAYWAAFGGSLHVLEWLQQQETQFDADTMEGAAWNDQLQVCVHHTSKYIIAPLICTCCSELHIAVYEQPKFKALTLVLAAIADFADSWHDILLYHILCHAHILHNTSTHSLGVQVSACSRLRLGRRRVQQRSYRGAL